MKTIPPALGALAVYSGWAAVALSAVPKEKNVTFEPLDVLRAFRCAAAAR